MLCRAQISPGLTKNERAKKTESAQIGDEFMRKWRITIRCPLSSSSPIKPLYPIKPYLFTNSGGGGRGGNTLER